MALINSIVCAIFFLILSAAIASSDKSIDMSKYSFVPAVTYYFIAKAILTDKNIKDTKNFTETNPSDDDEQKTSPENDNETGEDNKIDGE